MADVRNATNTPKTAWQMDPLSAMARSALHTQVEIRDGTQAGYAQITRSQVLQDPDYSHQQHALIPGRDIQLGVMNTLSISQIRPTQAGRNRRLDPRVPEPILYQVKIFPAIERPPTPSLREQLERFALDASRRVVRPTTNIRLTDTRPDIFVVTRAENEVQAPFDLQSFGELLELGKMPTFVSRACIQHHIDFDSAHLWRNMPRGRYLMGKNNHRAIVTDSYLYPMSCRRETEQDEFYRAIVMGGAKPQYPLMFPDLEPFGFDQPFADDHIRRVSLEQIISDLAGRTEWRPETTAFCSSMNGISAKRCTLDGQCVALVPTQGRSIVFLTRGNVVDGLDTLLKHGNCNVGPSEEYIAVALDVDGEELQGYVVLGPGQVSWLYAQESSMLLEQRFYTAETFAASLESIRTHFLKRTYNSHDLESRQWRLLCEILSVARQRVNTQDHKPIFTEVQRAAVLYEVRIFADQYRAHNPIFRPGINDEFAQVILMWADETHAESEMDAERSRTSVHIGGAGGGALVSMTSQDHEAVEAQRRRSSDLTCHLLDASTKAPNVGIAGHLNPYQNPNHIPTSMKTTIYPEGFPRERIQIHKFGSPCGSWVRTCTAKWELVFRKTQYINFDSILSALKKKPSSDNLGIYVDLVLLWKSGNSGLPCAPYLAIRDWLRTHQRFVLTDATFQMAMGPGLSQYVRERVCIEM